MLRVTAKERERLSQLRAAELNIGDYRAAHGPDGWIVRHVEDGFSTYAAESKADAIAFMRFQLDSATYRFTDFCSFLD